MSQESAAETAYTQLEEANVFNITGPIVIHYSSTSITGAPLFSYKDGELDLNFRGDDSITRKDTRQGEIVTVTLENVADGFIRTFTLLVPRIRLRIGDNISFDTLGIETIDRSVEFVLPPGPARVLHTYRSHQLQGVAQFAFS